MKNKGVKTTAALSFAGRYGFRRSPSYITNGHFLVPFKFEERDDEQMERIIPKIEDLPVKVKHTGIYLKHGKQWLVIFADEKNNAVCFDKKYIDPFNVTTLMGNYCNRPWAVFENNDLKLLLQPMSFVTLKEWYPDLLKVFTSIPNSPQ